MRFDPFRDLDRLAQQAFGGVAQVRSIPMDAYRRGDKPGSGTRPYKRLGTRKPVPKAEALLPASKGGTC